MPTERKRPNPQSCAALFLLLFCFFFLKKHIWNHKTGCRVQTPSPHWNLPESSNTRRHRAGGFGGGTDPDWGIYRDYIMKEYSQLRPDSLGTAQCFINVFVFCLFSFKTQLDNKSTWGSRHHTKPFYFPKVKCTKIGWDTEQEWMSVKEISKKKNHWVFDGAIVSSLCEHLREAFIHILNGKRQLKQVVYY